MQACLLRNPAKRSGHWIWYQKTLPGKSYWFFVQYNEVVSFGLLGFDLVIAVIETIQIRIFVLCLWSSSDEHQKDLRSPLLRDESSVLTRNTEIVHTKLYLKEVLLPPLTLIIKHFKILQPLSPIPRGIPLTWVIIRPAAVDRFRIMPFRIFHGIWATTGLLTN